MQEAASSDQAVFRGIKSRRSDVDGKGYDCSYDLRDDRTGEVLARCDIFGASLLFAKTAISDRTGTTWRLAPNRRIMPTRSILTDSDGKVALQFAFFKPMTRNAILDAEDRECFHLVDPRESAIDRAILNGPSQWRLMDKGELKARIMEQPREQIEKMGIRSRIRAFLCPSDWTLVSCGPCHLLAPPVSLALILAVVMLNDALRK